MLLTFFVFYQAMSVTIVLADDHPIVCQGISREATDLGMNVVHIATSPEKLVESVVRHRPNLVVTEVRLGGHDALKTLEQIKTEVPECQVIVYTASHNPTNIARASALGCYEFILKTSEMSAVTEAIKQAALGTPTCQNSLLVTTKTRMKRSRGIDSESPLTNRETQVLRHVSMGLKNREIGKSLGISVETVKEHVQNILRKLDVNDRTQAAVWAIRNDFI